jgi:hypothetical protein
MYINFSLSIDRAKKVGNDYEIMIKIKKTGNQR